MKMFQLLGVLFIAVLFLTSCRTHISPEVYEAGSYWIDDYFQQNNVRTPEPGSDKIEALIDGRWQEFELRQFPDSFMQWNIARRIETIEKIKERGRPDLAGPHNGVVATHGIRRSDSDFDLNNAVKGMGFIPKFEKIPEILELLAATKDADVDEKLDVLISLYEGADEYFDKDKQGSLELYSVPDFETQTFLNQMTNPVSTIVYLDIPSFKLKTIVRLLHPEDPDLNEYERMMMRYVNDVYSYFHGGRGYDYITVVYYVTEIYDNSPGRRDARGLRINDQ